MALNEFITPIFDRTAEDVSILKSLLEKGYENFTDEEKVLWQSDLKGALNASDLSRIEKNISVLLEEVGFIEIGNEWLEIYIPTKEDFEMIRNNLIKLCTYIQPSLINSIPDLPYNSYTKINKIEEIINQLYNLIVNIPYYYAGTELYSGQTIGLE